jgi:AMP-binding enzyme
MSAGRPDRAVTERIMGVADGAGHRAALANATDGTVTAWPRFAQTVRAAARGLGRRGLAEADTAAVFVEDAVSAAIAVNAIRAAGATACLISRDAYPADVAARLNACGARLLVTSAPLAELAAEGADRSRVRQIISFGEAAGATPFDSLLEAAGPGAAGESGHPEGNGQADRYDVRYGPRCDLAAGRGAELTRRDVVVAAPPCGDGPAYLSLLDRTLLAGALLVAAPRPLVKTAMMVYRGTAAIVPSGTVVAGFPQARVFPVA